MTQTSLLRTALLLFLFGMCGAPAQSAEWVVARMSGQAWIAAPGAVRQKLTVGTTVPEGHTLVTGANGRVRLDRNQESIMVSPNTVLTPEQSWWSGTTIKQQAG